MTCAGALTVGPPLVDGGSSRPSGAASSASALDGLVSQTSSAAVILAATVVGAPASTTQVVSSSVVGIGVGRRRYRQGRWEVVGSILLAWVTTFPPPRCWQRSWSPSGGGCHEAQRRFLPENPDVLDMLRRQAAVTCEGMEALVGWANAGEAGAAERVREFEHQADDTKRELRLAPHQRLHHPIDAEDLYVCPSGLDVPSSTAPRTPSANRRSWASRPTRRWRRWRPCWPTAPGISPWRSNG